MISSSFIVPSLQQHGLRKRSRGLPLLGHHKNLWCHGDGAWGWLIHQVRMGEEPGFVEETCSSCSDKWRIIRFVTNSNKDDAEKDRRLRDWLLSSLSEGMRSLMTGKELAWEVWSGMLKNYREELLIKIRTFSSAAEDNQSESLPSSLSVTTDSTVLKTFTSLVELGETLPRKEHLELLQTPDMTALRAFHDVHM